MTAKRAAVAPSDDGSATVPLRSYRNIFILRRTSNHDALTCLRVQPNMPAQPVTPWLARLSATTA